MLRNKHTGEFFLLSVNIQVSSKHKNKKTIFILYIRARSQQKNIQEVDEVSLSQQRDGELDGHDGEGVYEVFWQCNEQKGG